MKALLTSRVFWATLLTLAVLIIAQFTPGFTLDTDATAALLVVVVSYMVGVTIDPGPGGWAGVIKSRKFWSALVAVVMVFLDGFGIVLPLGLTTDILVEVVLLISGLIVSIALAPKPAPTQAPRVVNNYASIVGKNPRERS